MIETDLTGSEDYLYLLLIIGQVLDKQYRQSRYKTVQDKKQRDTRQKQEQNRNINKNKKQKQNSLA